MKVRIVFEFKGSLHSSYIKATVDADILDHKLIGMTKYDSLIQHADEELSCMITKGLVDVACDHMVDNFRVLDVLTNIPDTEPDYIF